MLRVLVASVGMVALVAGSAAAADLPPRYAPPVPAPFVAPIYNWTGLYIGVSGGGGWGRSRWDSTNEFDISGGLVGGTLGYNWQTGPWVFGLEGDISWANIEGTTNFACAPGCRTNDSWLSTVRGRLGYAFDRFLPYVTGGVAIGDIRADVGNTNVATETNAGWTIGGGIEFALFNNWTAKAEYLHVDLGNFNCGLACGSSATDNVSFQTNIFRGGINYRF